VLVAQRLDEDDHRRGKLLELVDGEFEAGSAIPLRLSHVFKVQEGKPSLGLEPLFVLGKPRYEYLKYFLFRGLLPEIVSQEGSQGRGAARVVQLLFDDVSIPKFFQAVARDHGGGRVAAGIYCALPGGGSAERQQV